MSKYCQKCGIENVEYAKFCKQCGSDLSKQEIKVEENEQSTEVVSGIGIGMTAFLVGFVAPFVISIIMMIVISYM